MPIARTWSPGTGKVATTLHDGFRDRLSRWSDIQEYLPYLYTCACSYPAVRVLELGTRKGNSTMAFLAAAEAVNGHVWSNDVNDVKLDPEGMLRWTPNKYWTFVCGDDMDEETQGQLPAQADVLFIDTSHEYEHTMRELRAYMPRVAPGGVALFHDTIAFPEVKQALDEYGMPWEEIPGWYGLGVIKP